MKTKLMIGAGVLALGVLSNSAFANADEGINLVGPKGWSSFFNIEGYDLNPRTMWMELVIVPQKSCKKMLAFFGAENNGIIESSGGYFEVIDTQPGRKYRVSMMTKVMPGGLLRLESVTCNNGIPRIETLSAKEGYSNFGGSRPAPAAPSLRDLPFFK